MRDVPSPRSAEAVVEIVDYDAAWPARFAAERALLAPILVEWLAGPIEHIGSTAVPGLCAKAVIDIMAPYDTRSPDAAGPSDSWPKGAECRLGLSRHLRKRGAPCPSCASGSRRRSTASSPGPGDARPRRRRGRRELEGRRGGARQRRRHGDGSEHVRRASRTLGRRETMERLALQGGTTFTFVTDGVEAALERARRAAGGKDVSLAGGAKAAQQYLAAGLVDEMEIHLVPTLLGSGERLFEGTGDDLRGLEPVRTVATPKVTHLKLARR